MFDKLKKILSSTNNDKEFTDPNIESFVENKKLNINEDNKYKKVSLLTPREYEIYLLLLEGFPLKECAEQMSIKYSTANTHMTGVYKKLDINTRAELIINYRGIKLAEKQ